jgi:flagellin
MSSILTNASALTALQALNMTQQNLATTQSQISTGLRVASAADNAAYWSIAQNLQSDTGVLSAVNSSLAQSQSVLGAATAAINTVLTTIHSIQTALSEANQPDADLTQIQTTLTALGHQLTDAVSGASFNGLNLLDGSNDAAPLNFVSGYNVSSAGVATFNSIALQTQALTGAGTTTTTTVAQDITDATTLKQLTALVDNTATVTAASYGNDIIDTTSDTTGDSFTVTSVNLARQRHCDALRRRRVACHRGDNASGRHPHPGRHESHRPLGKFNERGCDGNGRQRSFDGGHQLRFGARLDGQ